VKACGLLYNLLH